MDSEVLKIIKAQFNQHVVEESLERIVKCINLLTTEEVWYVHNANTNSIGNLILHLSGNVRQYIISGIGEQADIRERSLEFSANEKLSHEDLILQIQQTLVEANDVIQHLDYNSLSKKIIVQGFDHTILSSIIHVIEHLSYHVGQITYYTKYIKDIDTAYYGGLDLDVVS